MCERIYVVGFPKSGNTWLTRLLADALNAPVVSGVMHGAHEMASDVNERLSLSDADADFCIAKVHFYPELFYQNVDPRPLRIIYIYRDFRDVATSAYFYFRGRNEQTVHRLSFFTLSKQGPRTVLRYIYRRFQFQTYVENLSNAQIDWFAQHTGTWKNHIKGWHDSADQSSNTRFAFVSYERLLQDTPATVAHILQAINLPDISESQLSLVCERQSFNNVKNYLLESDVDSNGTNRKRIALRLMRKGIQGDWRNFMTRRTGKTVQRIHGDMLHSLGYETDVNWYKHLPLW